MAEMTVGESLIGIFITPVEERNKKLWEDSESDLVLTYKAKEDRLKERQERFETLLDTTVEARREVENEIMLYEQKKSRSWSDARYNTLVQTRANLTMSVLRIEADMAKERSEQGFKARTQQAGFDKDLSESEAEAAQRGDEEAAKEYSLGEGEARALQSASRMITQYPDGFERWMNGSGRRELAAMTEPQRRVFLSEVARMRGGDDAAYAKVKKEAGVSADVDLTPAGIDMDREELAEKRAVLGTPRAVGAAEPGGYGVDLSSAKAQIDELDAQLKDYKPGAQEDALSADDQLKVTQAEQWLESGIGGSVVQKAEDGVLTDDDIVEVLSANYAMDENGKLLVDGRPISVDVMVQEQREEFNRAQAVVSQFPDEFAKTSRRIIDPRRMDLMAREKELEGKLTSTDDLLRQNMPPSSLDVRQEVGERELERKGGFDKKTQKRIDSIRSMSDEQAVLFQAGVRYTKGEKVTDKADNDLGREFAAQQQRGNYKTPDEVVDAAIKAAGGDNEKRDRILISYIGAMNEYKKTKQPTERTSGWEGKTTETDKAGKGGFPSLPKAELKPPGGGPSLKQTPIPAAGPENFVAEQEREEMWEGLSMSTPAAGRPYNEREYEFLFSGTPEEEAAVKALRKLKADSRWNEQRKKSVEELLRERAAKGI